MTKTNYSKDAVLINTDNLSEVYDLDTVDQHETGINRARMRLPERYDIAKFYRRNKINTYSKDENGNKVKRNKGEYGHWWNKASKDLPDISDDFDWQITYNFPNTRRNNLKSGKAYGSGKMTYRRLYLILCEAFNGGRFFVDDYFNTAYKDSWVKEKVDVELNNLKDELVYYASDLLEGAKATKRGTLDRRYKGNRGMQERINEWREFAREWEERKGEELAEDIAEDIKRALANGEIPLEHSLADSTMKRRQWAGIEGENLFYATGDLIDNIQLFVKIGGNGKWRTEQGILV